VLGLGYDGSGFEVVALIRALLFILLWSGSHLGMPLSRSRARHLAFYI